jgi:hypothetical protein
MGQHEFLQNFQSLNTPARNKYVILLQASPGKFSVPDCAAGSAESAPVPVKL